MSLALHGERLPTRPVDAAEQALRIDLAAAYRLVARRGWDDLIYTHLTARVPNDPECFLINPFGLRFDEVTASNLVKIDGQGRIVGNSPHPVNAVGFRIHATVHAARPDAHCVMHLHHVNGVAVSAQAAGLLPLSQHAMRFYGQVGYHDYEGLTLSAGEGGRLVASLGAHPALFLRNHGTLVVGRSVAEAFVLLDTLDRACDIQLRAQAGGVPLVMPGTAVLERTLRSLIADDEPEGAREWPALLRLLEQTDPTYRD